MHRVLLLGAGKIGRMITRLLADTRDYDLIVADADPKALERVGEIADVRVCQIDASDLQQLTAALKDRESVISALSFRFNPHIAQAALATGTSYFDLTEDVETTRRVRTIAQQAGDRQIFMPQCGLAPGFISIVAQDLATSLARVDRIHMRVGALPQYPTGQLKYNLTWSTDGLINEYCNPCEAIEGGKKMDVLPLEGLKHFSLDGVRYEAFNTSGGLGTMCDTWQNRARQLNYKTVRYLGHRDLARFLVNELRMRERRELLKDILENAIPITFQDVVITFCTVAGWRKGDLVQISDARKIYARKISGSWWSAIQITTAASLCAVLDLHVAGKLPDHGFVRQEDVSLAHFLANRFGQYYASQTSAIPTPDDFNAGK